HRALAAGLLLHVVGLPEQDVDAPAVRARAVAARHLELAVRLGVRLLILGLVLVGRGLEVRVAAGPEDRLQPLTVGLVLEALEGLLFLREHDRPHVVEELLVFLVELLRPRRRGPSDAEKEDGQEAHPGEGHECSPCGERTRFYPIRSGARRPPTARIMLPCSEMLRRSLLLSIGAFVCLVSVNTTA